MELTQDPTSVYYLHPSDHTGMKLVSAMFNGTGFANWKRSMVIGLTAKNKMSFVDGTLTKPEITHADYKSWNCCNSMIIGWIISALEPQIAASILYIDTARDVWVDLEDRFGQVSSAQLYAIQQEIHQISQDSMPIAEYYTHLKKLWDEYDNLKPLPTCVCTNCTCDLTRKFLKTQQDQRIMIFLMKLSNNYANVRSNILMMENMPNLSQAYRMLLQEQSHREISHLSSNTEAVAFVADRRRYEDRSQFPNNRSVYQPPHRAYSNSNFSQNSKQVPPKRINYYCDHCKVPGHSMERCFKLNGYPANFKGGPSRKYGAYANTENVVVDATTDMGSNVCDSNPNVTGFTTDQCKQLMQMLNGKFKDIDSSSEQSAQDSNATANNALFAGAFNDSNHSW